MFYCNYCGAKITSASGGYYNLTTEGDLRMYNLAKKCYEGLRNYNEACTDCYNDLGHLIKMLEKVEAYKSRLANHARIQHETGAFLQQSTENVDAKYLAGVMMIVPESQNPLVEDFRVFQRTNRPMEDPVPFERPIPERISLIPERKQTSFGAVQRVSVEEEERPVRRKLVPRKNNRMSFGAIPKVTFEPASATTTSEEPEALTVKPDLDIKGEASQTSPSHESIQNNNDEQQIAMKMEPEIVIEEPPSKRQRRTRVSKHDNEALLQKYMPTKKITKKGLSMVVWHCPSCLKDCMTRSGALGHIKNFHTNDIDSE